MNITVNGKQRSIESQKSIYDLLTELELESKKVVVERNRGIVRRDHFAEVQLEEGDQIEILHFVGGG